jgi:hypothetical protein
VKTSARPARPINIEKPMSIIWTILIGFVVGLLMRGRST